MAGRADPLKNLDRRLGDLASLVNLNDQRVRQQVESMKEDIQQLRDEEHLHVTKESFSFYERAFWIVTASTVSLLAGSIAFLLNGK